MQTYTLKVPGRRQNYIINVLYKSKAIGVPWIGGNEKKYQNNYELSFYLKYQFVTEDPLTPYFVNKGEGRNVI